ncbi:hypothetical protein EVAR_49949_1 [Eumeta japonica]|uniref:Uncharacterized protein n=1 Tax=Eumeta variegata TaxID=151549 RepID=A0A4C1XWF0_EUMVA|nr:hypothetical protein EVAR_49949_1 [Eumeta japonica]
MSDFQGLMMKPEGSDDGTSKLRAPLSDPESQSWSKCIPRKYQQVQTRLGCVVSLWNTSVYLPAPSSDPGNQARLKCIPRQFQQPRTPLGYTLKITHGESTSQDNSGKLKHDWDMLFHYAIPVPTFWLHHQTLKITHGENTSQDNSGKLKHDWDMLFHYAIPVPTFWLHHQISTIIPYYFNVLGLR